MSTKQVELRGQITVGGAACPDPCADPGSSKIQGLQLRCTGTSFECVVSTDVPCQVQTTGVLGAEFVDLPTTEALDAIELLYLRSDQTVRLLLGADVASVLGVGGTFPTGFAGGETLDVDFDGANVAVTFTAAAQSAQQVANEINAAAALAALAFQPASVDSSGQLRLSGQLTGALGSVVINSGTALATLGLVAGSTPGAGEEVDITGAALLEFGRGQPGAPSRIQVSGQARVEVFAAGTPAP